MTETQAMSLKKRLTRAICQEQCAFYGEPSCWEVAGGPSPRCDEPGCQAFADAALSIALEEAARVAEGPSYRTNPNTGEASIRGTDGGNWSVPQPISGFNGSDYGTGRYDAAAAIRALKDAK